jgi:rhodanese-related sulfurtransferase
MVTGIVFLSRMKHKPAYLHLPKVLALGLIGYCLAPAQSSAQPQISRAEKLEARMRVEYVKATKDLHVPTIKAAELQKIIADTNLVLIDIRQPKEQDISMLPHALTTVEFAEKFRHGIPATKRIVVYCTIGYRSGKYAETLGKQGFKSENLEGGILAWSFVGGVLFVKNATGEREATLRIHTYSKEWNLVHPDYIGVW